LGGLHPPDCAGDSRLDRGGAQEQHQGGSVSRTIGSDDSYRAPRLFIGGHWRAGRAHTRSQVTNPPTEPLLDELSHASAQDLDDALAAVAQGFRVWRVTPAATRQRVLMQGVENLRAQRETIARLLTLEQGKP